MKIYSPFTAPASRHGRYARLLRQGSWVLVVGAFGALLSGCAAKAATVADGPPLATPDPPPRELGPVEDLAAVPITTATPEAPVAAIPRPEPASRTAARNSTPSKPEPATEQPAPPPAQPVVAATPIIESPRELRAAPSAVAAAEEKKVREVLQRAAATLNKVDYQRLNQERRNQYEQSKTLSEQADAALRDRNIPYAMTLADKARQLADDLAALR